MEFVEPSKDYDTELTISEVDLDDDYSSSCNHESENLSTNEQSDHELCPPLRERLWHKGLEQENACEGLRKLLPKLH